MQNLPWHGSEIRETKARWNGRFSRPRIWNNSRNVYVHGTRDIQGGRNTMHYCHCLTFVFVRAVSLLLAKWMS